MIAGGTPGFYIGNLGRIPVYADIGVIFLVLIAFMWAGFDPVKGSLLLLALVIAIVCHEVGHALIANLTKMDGVVVVISTLGGYCSYHGNPTHNQKMAISVAGPLVNGILAVAAWLTLTYADHLLVPLLDGLVVLLVFYIYSVNMILGIFNILPVFPLDGGQILLSAAAKLTRDPRRAATFTLYTAFIVGGVGYVLHMQMWNGGRPDLFLGFILFFLLSTAARSLGR